MDKQSRRQFLAAAAAAAAAGTATTTRAEAAERLRPNILLIMTDDQGYGDISAHGNPHLKTPKLDRLRAEGVRFERFYVSPVCTPTRAALMTGRYNYRTGAIDTFAGRSLIHPEEATMAELLGRAGYRTGIFGKWHLGDNYPRRAMDKGFEKSLVHRGGGLMQPSDWPGNTYFSPMLSRNGEDWKSSGYCTDVFTDAAMDFMAGADSEPFFCYLAYNAPHTPLEIADEWVAPYSAMGLDEDVAKVYGMCANIDWNVGRTLDKLAELGLADNTLVIFLTDNGPQRFGGQVRYNAGMRGAKTTVYEGGIRVPSFWRWPAALEAGKRVDVVAGDIDILPTLLDLAGAGIPDNLDGRSLKPLLASDNAPWPERYYFTQWHRGDEPELFRSCAVVGQRYKLVNGEELYDLVEDPGEECDIAAEKPEVAREMRDAYERWFADVGSTRGYEPQRVVIGTPHENPVVITRQDWRGAEGWREGSRGYWLLDARSEGPYDITLTFDPLEEPSAVGLEIGGVKFEREMDAGATELTFNDVRISAGAVRLDTWLTRKNVVEGAWHVFVKKQA